MKLTVYPAGPFRLIETTVEEDKLWIYNLCSLYFCRDEYGSEPASYSETTSPSFVPFAPLPWQKVFAPVHCGFDVKNGAANEWRKSDRADTIRTQTEICVWYRDVFDCQYGMYIRIFRDWCCSCDRLDRFCSSSQVMELSIESTICPRDIVLYMLVHRYPLL